MRNFVKLLVAGLFLSLCNCALSSHQAIHASQQSVGLIEIWAEGQVELIKPDGSKSARTISTRLGVASGFAVDHDKFVTANHVCKIKDELRAGFKAIFKIQYHDGKTTRTLDDQLIVLKQDPRNDLCLMYLPKPVLKPMPIAKANSLHSGDKIYIYGHPAGIFGVLTEGVAMNPHYFEIDEKGNIDCWIMASIPAFFGNSGSPIFNEYGEVVGVLVMGIADYNQVSFSPTTEALIELLH